MSKERVPDKIDSALFAMEDQYLQGKLQALNAFTEAHFETKKFIVDNENLTVGVDIGSPSGEEFKLDILPIIPAVMIGIAQRHFELLTEMGEGRYAQEVVTQVRRKWRADV